MPYGLIVMIASIGLVGAYVLVAGLLLVSFVWRYGMFLQVALSIFLSFYYIYLKSRS
jgi:hypothetical protein